MIIHFNNAFFPKVSNELYNEKGKAGHQPVKVPTAAAIHSHLISPHHPANKYK